MTWYKSSLFWLCVHAQCVHRLTHLCMHIRRPEVKVRNISLQCSTLLWGRSFIDPGAHWLTQLAGCQGPGAACPPPKCWDYRGMGTRYWYHGNMFVISGHVTPWATCPALSLSFSKPTWYVPVKRATDQDGKFGLGSRIRVLIVTCMLD